MSVHPMRVLMIGLVCFGIAGSAVAQSPESECPESQFTEWGMNGVVTPRGANSVRAEPSLQAEVIGQLTPGEPFRVIYNGVACAGGYLWREIETWTLSGWTAEIPIEGDVPFIVLYEPEPREVGQVADDGTIYVEESGLTFTVPAGLGITGVDVVPVVGWHGQGERPNSLVFMFQDEDSSERPATIEIYRYVLSDGSHEFGQSVELERLLTEQPSLLNYAAEERMPQEPIGGAAAVIGGAGTYLPFGSGNGLRYVTVFAQDSFMFTPEMTFSYVYRGITTDQAFLIAAQNFPVRVPANSIPNESEAILYTDAYVPYLRQFEASLALLPSSAFTPDLALLDAVFASLTITDNAALTEAIP